jgi:predicted dithiol-disulfide oxidoreductase (DUF899 family)
MANHAVVTREDWVAARKELLKKEKQLTGLHDELPGQSVFTRDETGAIFHTYSCFGRGDECDIGTYFYLDLTPKCRNETGPHKNLMDWVRHHDKYGFTGFVDATSRYRTGKIAYEVRT